MNVLKVTFLDRTDQEHCISFRLSSSTLSKKWQNVVNKNKNKDKHIHTVLMNTMYADIPRIHAELQDTVKIINKIYDQKLPTYIDKILTKIQLNILHEQFEIYGNRISELKLSGVLTDAVSTDDLHLKFCKLNELIHSYEDALTNKPGIWPMVSALIDYYPVEIYSPLKESDKIYLESDFKWGNLYLGYNTLGKDWLGVHGSNDVDVILRDQIRVQERFAAENWIYFGRDHEDFHNVGRLEEWYLQLPIDVKEKVPMNNLNSLSYGRLRIGTVIIDNYFLKYNNNPDVWKIPNSKAKLKWSSEIFTTFTKVVKFDLL